MSIEWCKRQGMKLVKPNNNLAEEYFRNAEETLRIANMTQKFSSNMWLATQKYYTEYLAAYAVLMKIGIKTEIHSCTIEIIELLEKESILPFKLAKKLKADKELRIDNQYYLKNRPVDLDSESLAVLLLNIRKFLDDVSHDDAARIRALLK